MLGGEAEVGLDPAASCCLTDCGNLEQHFGQVGFRQAKGWDTWREKLEQRLDNDKRLCGEAGVEVVLPSPP